MKYHVFNKKPSRSDIEEAMQYSDPEEQAEALAHATAPAKGELWQNVNTGRVLVIRSKPMPIQGSPTGGDYADNFGVVVADVIDNGLDVDFDLFFKLSQLLNYKKIGRLKKKLEEV
jgi:hypothetical protein|uniref:Uncharacterized protein n=1 Tax=Podoviridae sp. ct8mF2 TaxID=2825224 RepID=A0A8S5PML0_9CAUD|nr:MAG TPA: hypothetical protein [Podoviridae sp. ct8mF2]